MRCFKITFCISARRADCQGQQAPMTSKRTCCDAAAFHTFERAAAGPQNAPAGSHNTQSAFRPSQEPSLEHSDHCRNSLKSVPSVPQREPRERAQNARHHNRTGLCNRRVPSHQQLQCTACERLPDCDGVQGTDERLSGCSSIWEAGERPSGCSSTQGTEGGNAPAGRSRRCGGI